MIAPDIAVVTGAVVVIVGWLPPKERNRTQCRASAPESTDTEMYQALEKDLLISSDYQAGLVPNAAQVLDKVAGGVESTRDIRSVQFREPNEEEEEIHRTPGQRLRAEGRGRSILKKETANTVTGAIPCGNPTLSTTFPVALAVL